MATERKEKIEIQKTASDKFFLTGTVKEQPDGWVQIITERDEEFLFRKEQIIQRKIVTKGNDHEEQTEHQRRY